MKQINSLQELIDTIQSGNHDFFIGNGLVRSSKYIEYDDDTFYMVYSDFRTKNQSGEYRKSIIFRKIQVIKRRA